MIGKGNHHAHGVKLATYLMTGHPGERAELIDMRGFGPVSDLRDGFRAEHIRARDGTRADAPFFHVQFRGAHGEGLKLTDAQFLEIADRCDKALGLIGQPRAASLHIDRQTGDRHLHLGYSLVAEGKDGALFVKKVGLYKNKLKALSREIERDYGLKVVSSERQPGQARAADRKELEQSRRLETDGPAIRAAVLDSLHQADSGKAFKAALDAQGLMLANGDRRDCFVVVDQAGGHHALNKKLTGQTLAQLRDRLADIDRSQLPGVEQAQAMQAGRQPDRAEQSVPLTRMYRGIGENVAVSEAGDALYFSTDPARAAAFGTLHYVDVTAAEMARFERPHSERFHQFESIAKNDWITADPAVIARLRPLEVERQEGQETAQEARQRAEPQPGAETRAGQGRAPDGPEKRPLGRTAAQINAAWTETRNASNPAAAFRQAIEDRGPCLVYVTAEEAQASSRARAFAKAINRQNRALKEGFAVVDERGTVTRIDGRTTGDSPAEIEARLAGIDRSQLLTVAEARDVMKEASRAAWADAREQARPASAIERAVADALASTMTGTDFAAALDAKGLTVARVTASDVPALDALREADRLAGTYDEQTSGRRFAEIKTGELAAVTRQGDVFRLSPAKLDCEDIEQRLADVQTRLPSVVEARALNEQSSERKAEERAQRQAEFIAARIEQADAYAGKQELRQATRAAETVVHAAFETPVAAASQALDVAGGFIGGAAKIVSAVGDFLGGLFGGPKDTPAQAKQKAQARGNEESLHAQSYAAHVQGKEAEYDARHDQQKKAQQEQDLSFAARFGTPPTREASLGREHDREREREI